MPEYLLQQPASLNSLALTQLAKWIVSQVHNLNQNIQPECKRSRVKYPTGEFRDIGPLQLIGNKYVENTQNIVTLSSEGVELVHRLLQLIQNLISVLSHDLYTKLMPELILVIQANVEKISKKFIFMYKERVYMMLTESMFTSRLTSLMLTYPVPMHWCLAPLRSLSHHLTGLTRLELKLSLLPHRVKADPTLQADIIAILTPLHALKSLSLTSYCTDEILKCIIDHCTLVEELDISQSGAPVNDSSVCLLTQLTCLRRVYLSGTSVGPAGIEELLLSCDNLEHFDLTVMFAHMLGCSYVSQQKYTGRVFKINTFDTGASLEQLKFLAQICPQIRNMSLRKCVRDDECNLRALPEFNNIILLKLDGYDFYDDSVIETLRDIGLNLQTLHLNGVKQLDLDALIHISQTCSNLRHLSLTGCGFTELRSVYESPDIPPFRNLEKFSVGLYNEIPEPSAIMFVLCNCCNIEYIHLSSSILCLITEDLMLEVLNNNPLKYLQELTLWHKDVENIVTNVVLDRIIQDCISQPVVRQTPVSAIE